MCWYIGFGLLRIFMAFEWSPGCGHQSFNNGSVSLVKLLIIGIVTDVACLPLRTEQILKVWILCRVGSKNQSIKKLCWRRLFLSMDGHWAGLLPLVAISAITWEMRGRTKWTTRGRKGLEDQEATRTTQGGPGRL